MINTNLFSILLIFRYGFSHGGSGVEEGGRGGLLRQFHALERSTGVELYDRMVMGRRDHVSCDEVCRDVEVRFCFFFVLGYVADVGLTLLHCIGNIQTGSATVVPEKGGG